MGLQRIVVLCVVLVALGASAWYFTQNNFGEEQRAAEGTEQSERQREADGGSFTGFGSIAELLGRGQSITCDFRAENEEGISEGSVYIDGERERYSMHATYDAGTDSGDFGTVVDGDTMYWWGETSEQGKVAMKMTLPEQSETTMPDTSAFEAQSGTQISADEDVAYDCRSWRVDNSVFAPPNDVEFTDMDAMFQGMFEGMPEGFEMPEGMEHMMQ